MSKLVLTKFNKVANLNNYFEFEKSTIPKIGRPVFVYKKYAEKTNDDPTDIANIDIVKQSFGYMKLNKINNMTNTSVKTMTGSDKNGFKFIESRTKSLEDMYNDLADKFLMYLH
jgi:hypothetical protein